MEHKKLSRVLLAAGSMAVLCVALILFVAAPIAFTSNASDSSPVQWHLLIYCQLIGALIFAALYQYMTVCVRIGRNQSFCAQNVRSLKIISVLLFICAAMFPFFLLSGFIRANLRFFVSIPLCSLACMALGLLAWALHKLLQRAVRLQEENDLTI